MEWKSGIWWALTGRGHVILHGVVSAWCIDNVNCVVTSVFSKYYHRYANEEILSQTFIKKTPRNCFIQHRFSNCRLWHAGSRSSGVVLMDRGWGKLKWWSGSAKGSWRCRSKDVWEDSAWTSGLHKRMGTSLQAAQPAQVGNISRVNISCRKGGLNDKEIDNMQNYYTVLIRRISNTKNETVFQGSFLCLLNLLALELFS